MFCGSLNRTGLFYRERNLTTGSRINYDQFVDTGITAHYLDKQDTRLLSKKLLTE